MWLSCQNTKVKLPNFLSTSEKGKVGPSIPITELKVFLKFWQHIGWYYPTAGTVYGKDQENY